MPEESAPGGSRDTPQRSAPADSSRGRAPSAGGAPRANRHRGSPDRPPPDATRTKRSASAPSTGPAACSSAEATDMRHARAPATGAASPPGATATIAPRAFRRSAIDRKASYGPEAIRADPGRLAPRDRDHIVSSPQGSQTGARIADEAGDALRRRDEERVLAIGQKACHGRNTRAVRRARFLESARVAGGGGVPQRGRDPRSAEIDQEQRSPRAGRSRAEGPRRLRPRRDRSRPRAGHRP